MLRWILILDEYSLEIEYIPSHKNIVADALSRNVSPTIRSQVNDIVSATKSIIETHVAEKAIRIIEIIIKKTTTEFTTQRRQC